MVMKVVSNMLLRVLRKWDYDDHDYRPYYVPAEWKVAVYSDDLNDVIQCAHCGKELTYGDSLTSLEIHTVLGMGYSVCSECYDGEFKRKMDERKRQNES